MYEHGTPETSGVEARDLSQAKSPSVHESKNNGELIGSAETKSSPLVQEPSACGKDGTPPSVIRKRYVLTTIYVVTTCVIGILSYYGGKLHARFLAEQEARPHMIVETLWATPLARTHLRTHPKALNLTEFNRRLADAVAEDYAAFQANYSDHDGSDVNDLFFEHQVGAFGEKSKAVRPRVERLAHRKLAEFNIVASCAATLADRLLQKFGQAAVEGCERRLQGWATLHDSSSRHVLHVHAASTLSIVYYVRLGEGAPLRLYDPRGPRPPFEGSVEVWPEEGEMIAFPGWVAHEVESGSGQRISLVFNVPGNWEGDEFDGETIALGRWSSAKGWTLDFGEGMAL